MELDGAAIGAYLAAEAGGDTHGWGSEDYRGYLLLRARAEGGILAPAGAFDLGGGVVIHFDGIYLGDNGAVYCGPFTTFAEVPGVRWQLHVGDVLDQVGRSDGE